MCKFVNAILGKRNAKKGNLRHTLQEMETFLSIFFFYFLLCVSSLMCAVMRKTTLERTTTCALYKYTYQCE